MSDTMPFSGGETVGGTISSLFNTLADSPIGTGVQWIFHNAANFAGGVTDATTGLFAGMGMSDDWAKVASVAALTVGTSWAMQGRGFTGMLMAGTMVAGMAMYSSDNISPDSTVGRFIEGITPDGWNDYRDRYFGPSEESAYRALHPAPGS